MDEPPCLFSVPAKNGLDRVEATVVSPATNSLWQPGGPLTEARTWVLLDPFLTRSHQLLRQISQFPALASVKGVAAGQVRLYLR